MDFPGVWQHFAIPADALTEETFEEGIGFERSSVVGWGGTHEGRPPGAPPPRDPRNIARKAVSYMRSTGLADDCRLAPELEFFVFDRVRFDQNGHEAFYQ